MSLERFRRERLVVLSPRATAYEAGRAMADNAVGAVLVGEEQRIVGVVTDRDLALEVVAGDLDPRGTYLRDVMSDEVVACEVTGTIEDVIRVMRERGVRRVPIVEDGHPVGLVTLDDLLVDSAITTGAARSIVVAQLEAAARPKEAAGRPAATEPAGPSPAIRLRAARRRSARAENTYGRLLRAVERDTGLESRDRADRSLVVVLGMICERLLPEEAKNFIAQLPSKLHDELEQHCGGPDRRVTTDAIVSELERQLSLERAQAHDVLCSVCDAIAESVSAGEIEAVRGQLPAAMKELFPQPPLERAV
jgi:CBS domain-containing protein/uncharacterized protein (DUF2267 family)